MASEVLTLDGRVKLTQDELLEMKFGEKLESFFGAAPATIHCVEVVEGKWMRWRVFVYACEVAELKGTCDKEGSWTVGEA